MNPINQIIQFWKEAREKKDPVSDCLYLATSDEEGKPHVRTVLIKSLNEEGLGFVTNAFGPKAKQIKKNKWVEGCIHWPSLNLQIRIQGPVKKMSLGQLMTLWKNRSREAQILYTLGVPQSSVVDSFASFMQKFKELQNKLEVKKILPYFPAYVGFIIQPTRIEILHYHPSRLSEREAYEKEGKKWNCSTLAP